MSDNTGMEEVVDKELYTQPTEKEMSTQDDVQKLLSLSSEAFTRELRTIKATEVGLSEPLKLGRAETIIGLSKTVAELGVVSPIHVITVEQADDDDEDSYKYMMLSGTRRLYGAVKNGIKELEAVVWDFKDKDLGRQIALPLSLLLNRVQKRSWREVWDLYQVLEMQSSITPGTLEYLLQLESGDAMKLKDCMLCDYEEVKEMVLGGEKTLEQAYKQLQKLRKEENKLAMEEHKGLSDSVEGAETVVSEESTPQLSDSDVEELLELGGSMTDEEATDTAFEDLDKSNEVRGVDKQEVGKRHPVDPVIKQGTFDRDGFQCRCCGTGKRVFLGTLIYHHLVPVHCGGSDTIDNGLTLCDSCHQVLHIYEQGKLAITKEMFEEYDEREQKRIKLIMKYGNIAIEADKRRGKKREDVIKESKINHRMPGVDLKETTEMYNRSN